MISPWIIVLIMAAAALVGPLFVYRNIRSLPFSLTDYLQQIHYFLYITVPLGCILFWVNWRESVKRKKRYYWVGKFEVVDKSAKFCSCYLNLSPGEGNKLKVDQSLYNKTHIGDYVIIRRDALGRIDEVRRVKDVVNRLTRVGG